MNRRDMTKGCCSAVAAMIGDQLNHFAFASEDDKDRDILVVVFLRGGCDGLSLVAPAADKDYITARGGNLAVQTSGTDMGLELNYTLNNTGFWLHPKAGALHELYQNKNLAIIHACGLTNGTRSHFDAIDLMERGTPNDKSTTTGWLSRHLNSINATGLTNAFSVGQSAPVSLLGNTSAISLKEMNDFKISSDDQFNSTLMKLYNGYGPLHKAGRSTLEAIEYIRSKAQVDGSGDFDAYEAEAKYPEGWPADSLSKSLKTAAQLIKMDVGLNVATVDFGGWDNHEGQNYIFPLLTNALSQCLGAFYNDMHQYHKKLTVVVMSEFGRRLKANESWGTDHGHGGVMMVLGGNVEGGKMYGNWPGLATEQLDNRVDLAVTTDYRTVLSEILSKRLANNAVDKVFPGLVTNTPLGICRL